MEELHKEPVKPNVKGRFGVKTKATVRKNKYDRKFQREAFVFDDNHVPYSLNRGKRWETIEKMKQELKNDTAKDNDEDEDENEVDDSDESTFPNKTPFNSLLLPLLSHRKIVTFSFLL
jgi:DNA-binding GntR family transcriptional regulator